MNPRDYGPSTTKLATRTGLELQKNTIYIYTKYLYTVYIYTPEYESRMRSKLRPRFGCVTVSPRSCPCNIDWTLWCC